MCRDAAFFWGELTTKDFEGLDPATTIAILPVAATEQHGPHLPVMTDTAIADGMLALLRQRLPDDVNVLVLPVQPVGKSNEHILSPGTLTLSADTLLRVLVEIGESVHRAGLRKLVLANSHGGNASVIATAARELRVRFDMLAVATHWRWFGLPDGMYDAVESEARHPCRRHRDVADARFPPRSRAHGQGQEFRIDGGRDGERIQAPLGNRHAFVRLDRAGSQSGRRGRRCVDRNRREGQGDRDPSGRWLHRVVARHDAIRSGSSASGKES